MSEKNRCSLIVQNGGNNLAKMRGFHNRRNCGEIADRWVVWVSSAPLPNIPKKVTLLERGSCITCSWKRKHPAVHSWKRVADMVSLPDSVPLPVFLPVSRKSPVMHSFGKLILKSVSGAVLVRTDATNWFRQSSVSTITPCAAIVISVPAFSIRNFLHETKEQRTNSVRSLLFHVVKSKRLILSTSLITIFASAAENVWTVVSRSETVRSFCRSVKMSACSVINAQSHCTVLPKRLNKFLQKKRIFWKKCSISAMPSLRMRTHKSDSLTAARAPLILTPPFSHQSYQQFPAIWWCLVFPRDTLPP